MKECAIEMAVKPPTTEKVNSIAHDLGLVKPLQRKINVIQV